jgi:drug/metabolite transporter (DMT)-like permease
LLEAIHPNILALISAAAFASAQIIYRSALQRLSISAAALTVNLTLTGFSLVIVFASGGVGSWSPAGVLWFMAAGFVGGFSARYLNYLSITYIGLARTHVMSQTTPLWSAVVAVVWLGEDLRLAVGLATVAILGGTLLLVRDRGGLPTKIPRRYYVIPAVSSVFLAFTPALRKLGFESVSSAALGLALSMGTGAIFVLLVRIFVRDAKPGDRDRKTLFTVFLGGCLNFVAGYCFITAIKTGSLVSIVPITRLSVLFVLIFSWIFIRQQEGITWRVIAGGVFSVAGATIIAISG